MLNSAHLHLVLNHVPIIGTALALFVLVVGLIRKSDEVKKVSMLLMLVTALLTIPVYISGNSAEGKIEGNYEDVDETFIEIHEDFALYSFIVMDVIGAAAILIMLLYKKQKPLPNSIAYLMLILMLIVSAMMGYTATMGARIHHPEVREDRLPWETKTEKVEIKNKDNSKTDSSKGEDDGN